MSCAFPVSRRSFVGIGAAAMALLACRPGSAISSAASAATPRVAFDPLLGASLAFARTSGWCGADCRAITGDRYRFALDLAADAAEGGCVAGLCTYADFLVLEGTLREARYRLIGHGIHFSAGTLRHDCRGRLAGCEPALRHSGNSWPQVLALAVTGAAVRMPDRTAAGVSPPDGPGLVSWLMLPRDARASSPA